MANEQYKGYSFELEGNKPPVAVVLPLEQEAVVGAVAKLDGRASVDPEGSGLTYTWSFVQVPIGSQAEKAGFTLLEDDGSIVTFAPDIIGTYKVQLVVSDSSLDSDPTTALVDTRVILVPHHTGYIPDASFIWNYLSDFWTKVDGRKKFETFWSAAIQSAASEMLRIYQYDYNKSIKDIQEVFQKRWLAFSPSLSLDRTKTSFILADDQAGLHASTFTIDPVTGSVVSPQPASDSLVAVPISEGNFEKNSAGQSIAVGRVLQLGGKAFTKARAASMTKSLNYGVDGVTDGTNSFFGGGFDSGQVGKTLKILSGTPTTYLVSAFVNEGHVQLTNLDGSAVLLAAATGITYTVLPATSSHSAFFADQVRVPAGVEPEPWRLSATLISTEFDLETQGVSLGDVLEVEISRTDVTLSSIVFAQVVSVDRNRLGFVLNLKDLVDGVAGGWFTDDMIASLAADLQVSGLSLSHSGGLVYSKDSEVIYETVSTPLFRRAYFETALTPDSVIDLVVFSVKARPVQIIRNHRVVVDTKLVSVPILQEYIKQPQVVRDGSSISFVTEGGQVSATRDPYVLVENLDYVIDDDSMISGVCNVISGLDEIEIPYGDLVDRSVRELDTLSVTLGIVTQTFTIRKVLAPDRVRVYPTPTDAKSNASFTLSRRVSGKYLRFIKDTFTKKSPAPVRLWSEVSYLDNNDAVEANFGAMVGVTQEQLTSASIKVPYKSAIAGLMYALARGPTVSNLTLSAQILLGLPFTQNAGVITEINPDFRKRDDGSPLYGRILVEARNSSGTPTGITNIYLYPQGRQIKDTTGTGKWIPATADYSGLANNPNTGVAFAVGDSVAQFVPLSKGVQLQEYKSTPDWTERLVAQGDLASLLQRYHSFQLSVNSDLVAAADIDLAAQFMNKAKAHYLKLTASLLKSVEDIIDIEDVLIFGRLMSFYEVPGLGMPSTLKFDDKDEDGAILSVEGTFYTKYLYGSDLSTTQGSSVVTSASGGFISARAGLIESHDSPLLKPGDLLVITDSVNAGRYVVNSVDSDTQLTLVLGGVFATRTLQTFQVYRPLKNPIWSGTVEVITGDGMVNTQETVGTLPGGIASAGVMPGDVLVFYKEVGTTAVLSSRPYTIVRVVPDLVSPHVVVIPDPMETTDTYHGFVIRESLITRDLVTEYGYSVPNPRIQIETMAGSRAVYFHSCGRDGWLNACLLRPGDTVELVDSGTVHTIIANEPKQARFWISPPASFSGVGGMNVYRTSRGSTPITFDTLESIPEDLFELTLATQFSASNPEYGILNGDLAYLNQSPPLPAGYTVLGQDLLQTAGSTDVQTAGLLDFADLGVLPGDFIVILEGGDSLRDLGYGLGVYPILSLLSATQLRLTGTLTVTSPGVQFGIRRKRPQ